MDLYTFKLELEHAREQVESLVDEWIEEVLLEGAKTSHNKHLTYSVDSLPVDLKTFTYLLENKGFNVNTIEDLVMVSGW